jgi:hypothetical protein
MPNPILGWEKGEETQIYLPDTINTCQKCYRLRDHHGEIIYGVIQLVNVMRIN